MKGKQGAGEGIPMARKGFVISFDGMLALSIAMILFVAATAYFAKVESTAVSSAFLKEFSMDSATVLEKSELLEGAVERGDVSELRAFVNRMPESICLEVKVFEESDLENAVMLVMKSGCTAVYSEKTAIKRGFLAGSAYYLAEVGAWYKVSG